MSSFDPAFNEIWYTNGSTTKATNPYKLDAFGANIISNAYDSYKQCWVISFDKEITTIGEQAFDSCTDLVQVTLPDSVRVIEKQAFRYCLGLKEIPKANNVAYYGFAAFQSCNSLSIVDIPNGVETIRGFVFYDCGNIRKVMIPKSVKEIGLRAFSYKQHLTEVYCKAIIPPSTITLENQWNPFDYYDNDNVYPRTGFKDIFCKIFVPIESLTQYKTAPYWCNYADNFIGFDFENNKIVESNPNYKAKPFDNEIWYVNGSTIEPTMPNRPEAFNSKIISNVYNKENECWILSFEYELTKVGEYAFSSRVNLKSIILPNTIKVIEELAFQDCSGLASVIMGKGVSEIKDYAFNGCKSITDITIPDNVTSIGCNPFCGCLKLSEFRGKFASEDRRYLIVDGKFIAFTVGCGDRECVIPNTVTSIGDYAFCGGVNLINVSIPKSVTSIGKFAFGWCRKLTDVVIPNSVTIIGESAFQTCYGLCSMIIPDSVVEIGEAAFIWCTNLKSVYLPNSVRVIGQRAFKNCLKLTSINIPDRLDVINHRTFFECTDLTSIIIPEGIKEIESEAFYSCRKLKAIYCKAKTPPQCRSLPFDYKDITVYVPAESLDLYKSTSEWSDYFEDIVGYNFNN